jgi:hypothetical protein
MLDTDEIRRQISLRVCRNKKYQFSERFVHSIIKQSIQHEKSMLNCNLRVFDGRDDSKSRTEVRKLATLAFCEIENRSAKNQQPMHSQGIKKQVADQSGGQSYRSRVKG